MSPPWQPLVSLKLHSHFFLGKVQFFLSPKITVGVNTCKMVASLFPQSSSGKCSYASLECLSKWIPAVSVVSRCHGFRNKSAASFLIVVLGAFLHLHFLLYIKRSYLDELFNNDIQQLTSFIWSVTTGYPWLLHNSKVNSDTALVIISSCFYQVLNYLLDIYLLCVWGGFLW